MLTRRVRSAWNSGQVSFGIAVVFALSCTPHPDPLMVPDPPTNPARIPPDAMSTGGSSPAPSPTGTGGRGESMAAGGAIGQSGSGGASGSSGDSAAAGDAAIDVTAPDATAVGPAETTATSFACNRVLGIKQTGEWFSAGFEAIVDNARWEVVPVHNGHIELWADPKNAIWAQKPQSPCAPAASPDRVIFVGTNYDYTTVDEFLPKYVAVIENIKARFPGVARIELATHVRAPGNVACPGALDFKTTIKPAQDQALDMAVAKYPGLVVASPRFEVSACSDYGLYPHFKGGGAATVATRIGEHYKAH
jgi:hypothetical protein